MKDDRKDGRNHNSDEIDDDELEFNVDDDDEQESDNSESGGNSDDDLDKAIAEYGDKAELMSILKRLSRQWRRQNIQKLVDECLEIGYQINSDEFMVIADFAINDKPEVMRTALATSIDLMMRLGFHNAEIKDLLRSAGNDLMDKEAQSFPDYEEKKEKKLTEEDRKNIVKKETIKERDYKRKVQLVSMKFDVLVNCNKEYVNVLKALLKIVDINPYGGSNL